MKFISKPTLRILFTGLIGGLTILAYQNFSVVNTSLAQPKNRELYVNPVASRGCADPAVFFDQDRTKYFYLACTGGRFPIQYSRDLINWYPLGKSIINNRNGFARWAEPGRNWAPAFGKINDTFLAYYTQNVVSDVYKNSYNGRTNIWGAIGVSTTKRLAADDFEEELNEPMVRDDESGGIIDPSFFKDPSTNKNYLLYKPDGNGVFQNSSIVIRQLSPKGLGFAGPGVVIQNGGSTIETLIEGPEMVHRNGYYYLFFSSGSWAETSYRVYVVRSKNINGPYEGKRLVLSTREGGKFEAPGHGSIVRAGGKLYYVYHAWEKNHRELGRLPMVDRIFWFNDWPIINNGHPSELPQYKPTLAKSFFHQVDFTWKNPGFQNPRYSFDLKLENDVVLGPCVSAKLIQNSESLKFRGICHSKGNRRVRLSTNLRYRVCAAEGGQFGVPNKSICSPFRKISNTEIGVKWR